MPLPMNVSTGRALLPTGNLTGIAARWTLDDTTAGYIDTVSGLTLAPGGTAPTSVAGVRNNAAAFGGAGYLSAPSHPSCHLRAGFAVELWAYPTGDNAGRIFCGRDVLTQAGAQREWYIIGGTLNFSVANSAGSIYAASSPAGLTVNTWHHIVGTFDGVNSRIYVNGVLVGTSGTFAGVIPAPSTQATYLSSSVGGRTYIGRLDEPTIWQFGAAGDPGAAFWLSRYNLYALAALRSTLAANATYAWISNDATLTAWPDMVAGVNAAPVGTGTTISTLATRPCVNLNGSGYYVSDAFASAIAQPFAIVAAFNVSGGTFVCDGLTQLRGAITAVSTTYSISGGTSLTATAAIRNTVSVVSGVFNGASSEVWRNGVQTATGAAGSSTGGLTGLVIGARGADYALPIVGSIGAIAVCPVANRAAVEAAMRAFYGA